MERSKTDWVRVSRAAKCVICGKPDHCTRTADGRIAKCMRVESAKPVAKGGWIHKLEEGTMPIIVEKAKPAPKRTTAEWRETVEKMFSHQKAPAMRERLAAQLGVAVEALERLRVGWSADYAGEFAGFPIRNVMGYCVGVTRRYLDGGKKKTMQGSRGGLYYADGWRDAKGPILLPEGASDVAALLTLGLCCVGRWSNVGSIEDLAALLKYEKRPIVVIGERDQKPDRRGGVESCRANCAGCAWCWPGRYGAVHTSQCLSRELRRKVHWRLAPDEAKDAREWLQTHGANGGLFLSRLWR